MGEMTKGFKKFPIRFRRIIYKGEYIVRLEPPDYADELVRRGYARYADPPESMTLEQPEKAILSPAKAIRWH